MKLMMEGISGGGLPKETYLVPKTHEEIDEKWDIVQSVMDTYGVDVAYSTITDCHLPCILFFHLSKMYCNPTMAG